jgi:hypothetical protein
MISQPRCGYDKIKMPSLRDMANYIHKSYGFMI